MDKPQYIPWTPYILGAENSVEIAPSPIISVINVFLQKFKIADKNGGKMMFSKKCQTTLRIPWGSKISTKKPLSHTISKINVFVQKFKMSAKNGVKNNFWQKQADGSMNTLWFKNFVEMALPCTVSKMHAFLHYTETFKMTKNGMKTILGKKW